MALANYTELKAALARALNRSDLGTEIDDWIVLFEKEMSTVLSRREMAKRATQDTVAGTATYALPTDFGDAISMHLDDGTTQIKLTPSTWDRIATSWTTQGTPEEFAITANEFILGPTPDDAYEMELYYYRTVPAIASTTTSWLLTDYPRLYLFGVLAQGAAILADPKADAWASAYQNALRIMIRDQIKERGFGGGPVLRTDIFGDSSFNIVVGE